MKSNNTPMSKRGKIIASVIAILLACCIIVSGIMLFKPHKSAPVKTDAAGDTPSVITIESDSTELSAGDEVTLTITLSNVNGADQWWFAMETTLVPMKTDGTMDTELCNALSLVSSKMPSQLAAENGDWSMPFNTYSPNVIDRFQTTGKKQGLFFMFAKGTSGEMTTDKNCTFEVVLKVSEDYSGSSSFSFALSTTQRSFVTICPAGNAAGATDDTSTNGTYSAVSPTFQVGEGGGSSTPVNPTLTKLELSSTSATAGYSTVAAGGSVTWKLSEHAENSTVYFRATVPTGATASAGTGLTATGTAGVFSGRLSYGTNAFTVRVQGTNSSQTYTYTINLKEQLNGITNITANPTLAGFTFNRTTASYNINVENTVSSVTLTVTLEGDHETLTTSGKTPTSNTHTGKVYTLRYSLSNGSNAITVRGVSDTSTNGTAYTLNITRANNTTGPSSDSTLGGLEITSGGRPAPLNPSFRPDRPNYTVTVDDINDIQVNPIPNDGNATTSTDITDNGDGTKTVTVTVTAQDGSTTDYVITVTEKEPVTGDALLDDIRISNNDDGNDYTIRNFDPATFNYKIYVPSDSDHPRLTAIAANSNAEIVLKVNGIPRDTNNIGTAMDNIYLSNIGAAALVEIIVTTDDDTKTYTLEIVRSSESPYLSYLTVGNYQIYDANGRAINGKDEDAVRDVMDFYVTIENADTTVSIDARANSEESEVRIRNDGQFTVADLFGGSAHADLQISIVPLYGDIVIYNLHLTRKPALSDNTNAGIRILEITTQYNPVSFNSEYEQYSDTKLVYGSPYHVPYNVSSLTVEIILEDQGELVAPATYQIFYGDVLKNDNGRENANVRLAYGINVVIITILASDQATSKTIAVIVYRDEASLFPNPSIKEIPEFSNEYTAEVTDYSYTVGNDVTKLTVQYLNWDKNLYTCVVEGADNLKVGLNTITICLFEKSQNQGVSTTAASSNNPDAVRTITLNVYRESNGPSTIWLVLFIIFLLLAIIEFIILLLLLMRNRKDDQVTQKVIVSQPAPAHVVRPQVAPVQFVAMPQPQVQYVSVPQPQPQPQPEPEKSQQPVNVEVKITGCGDSDGYYKTKK